MAIITLTTDFGMRDGYPGVVKGVILGIAPDATIVDVSHEVGPQNVREAAFVLRASWRYFPPSSIHVVIVDPGVGSERRLLAVRTTSATFVAPDNGVLSWALLGQQIDAAVEVTDRRYWLERVSNTFHGRDILAPVAAHLARGLDLRLLGPPVNEWITLAVPRMTFEPDGSVLGEVIHVDRFGNLITGFEIDAEGRIINAPSEGPMVLTPGAFVIEALGRPIDRLSSSYAASSKGREPGELLAMVGSAGFLELAVRDGNAAAVLGARVGSPVRIRWK